ncbi:VQ-like protein [Artemisia annua]|uniref:VQ-like protein n=1 Tax=Artemisia annua TaxID=35608 RepID=A0A2U1M8D8_ARTAN|nr:VQ-like protein [Artemisia annua]
MASSFKDNNEGSNPNPKLSTTFVEADPSNFLAIVQLLTGAHTHPQVSTSSHKLVRKPSISKVGHQRSSYKLHERRKAGKKLEINLARPATREGRLMGYDKETVMGSPVSTLDVCGRRSPETPMEEEDRAIAEKGYYLHPSPMKGSQPQLLVLFPLNSPKNDLPS